MKNNPYKYAGIVKTGKQLLEEDGELDLVLLDKLLGEVIDDTPVPPENNQETHNDEEERIDGS